MLLMVRKVSLISNCRSHVMNTKRKARTRRTSTHSGRRAQATSRSHRSFLHIPFASKGQRWAWLLGGMGAIVLYVWAFYYFFVGPTGFRWRALYGDDKYPEGYEVHGIDISHYQGSVNWDRLRSNALVDGCPIRFIIIKSTEGSSSIDPNFEDNFYQAREYGFIRGAYHFWSVNSGAREQAYYFLQKVHLERGDLPPVLDVEHKPKNQSVEDFQTDILTWLHIVENKYGVKPIIYTYYKFKDSYLSAPVFDDYPYWIAHYYVDKVEYQGKWKFWQHTDAGKLPGIKGSVDLNIYNGSYYDLMRLTIGNQENMVVAE